MPSYTLDQPLYDLQLAPHAMPFGAGPEPGTLWNTESWLAMVEDSDPYAGPSSSVNEHEDDHPTPPTPPKPLPLIHYRVYSISPDTDKPEDLKSASQTAEPLIDFLTHEGVHPDEIERGMAEELSARALRSLDPGLLEIAEGNSFYFLDIESPGRAKEGLTWIGVDVGEDGDFDSFLGYDPNADEGALPIFVTISADAPRAEINDPATYSMSDADGLF